MGNAEKRKAAWPAAPAAVTTCRAATVGSCSAPLALRHPSCPGAPLLLSSLQWKAKKVILATGAAAAAWQADSGRQPHNCGRGRGGGETPWRGSTPAPPCCACALRHLLHASLPVPRCTAGVRDLIPEIEGFEEFWGRGIWVRAPGWRLAAPGLLPSSLAWAMTRKLRDLHRSSRRSPSSPQVCLYCDAFEYTGQPMGAYGNWERGVHIAFEAQGRAAGSGCCLVCSQGSLLQSCRTSAAPVLPSARRAVGHGPAHPPLQMLLWSNDVTLFTDGEPLAATDLVGRPIGLRAPAICHVPLGCLVSQLANVVLAACW